MFRSCCWGWCGRRAWRLDLRFCFWLAPIVFSLILSPFVSVDLQPFNGGTAGLNAGKLFLIPEEYPAAGAVGYRYLSGAEPQSHAG